ncbi:Cdk5rap3 protein, partial [Globisporangium splendens]
MNQLRAAKDEVVDNAVNLDFEAEAAEINWDFSIDGSGSGEDVTTIDWGIETISDDTATSNNDGAVDLDTPVEIDWDISSAEVGESIVEPVSIGDAVVASTPSTTHEITISGEPTRVGLLSENEFRTRILNNLLELRTFLRQRQQELKGADNVAFANQFQAPLQLILIKNSERYLDRHVASLEMLTKQIDKSRREVQALEDKNVDLIDATSKIQPQIDAFVAITKKLKKELELALPALFKGYKVNIVGEVNNL